MSQRKSECTYRGCPQEPLERSKDGRCIFHANPEEKDISQFNNALRHEIENLKSGGLTYSFEGYIFVGDINFRKELGVTVIKRGVPVGSVSKRISFLDVQFRGEVDFSDIEFRAGVSFSNVEFHKPVFFKRTKFCTGVSFSNVEFHKPVFFKRTKFCEEAYIAAKFITKGVSFAFAVLENVRLTPLNLDESAWIDFTGARLRNTEIRRKDIRCHIMQEQEKHFSEAKEIYLLLKNNFHSLGRYDDESWAFRKEKEMERRSFWHFRKEYKERELGKKWTNKGVKFCFYVALLDFEYPAKYLQDYWFPTSRKKTKRLLSYMVNFLQDPIASVKGEFKNFASFVVKNKQNKIGNFSRKELSRVLWFYMKYPMKCFWSTFLKYLYEWGEWPWLIFLWCVVTIFIFSVLYLRWDIIAKDGTLARSYLDKLYFSGVTFTTLGYGDYSPVGGARFFAFIESFLGVFLIALFIFSFARRTAGR